jgi:hypothetical protein
MRVFENRVLRRIFGSKIVEVIGNWRKLHNEELNDLYSSTNIIGNQVEEDEVSRASSMNRENRNACRILLGKAEGKRPLGRPRRTWVDNIKMDLK